MYKQKLSNLIENENIANDLDEEQLRKLANKVHEGYSFDLESCNEWLSEVKKVEELATLCAKKKSYPLPNSANIKFPIITKACYEYSSRTYPEIVKDGQIVKTKTIGKDFTGEKEIRARKVADYMNWQLYWQNDDWELELDRLLNRLALIGFLCKKTYYDPIRGIVKSELCEPQDLIIHSSVKSMEDAPRVTHVIHLKLNDLIEGARAGIYSEEVVDKLIIEHENDNLNPDIDVLEQHTLCDLDDDSYSEPYIITVLKDRPEVLRIVARYDESSIKRVNNEVKYIVPTQYFTDFHFLVNPKGKFQSVGFGILLLHLNETINTILNQLVDSGQLANLRGGYKDSRLKEISAGQSNHNPGEFKNVKLNGVGTLKDGILPIDYKEPSTVLYQLLGLLIQAANEVASTNDFTSGNTSPENAKTGATQIMQNEAVKIHNSINKRIYRSLGNEFYKIFKLDGKYLDPEQASKVLDEDITLQDFDDESVDVIPVADPNLASSTKLASEIQMLQALIGMPGVDPLKVTQKILSKLPIDHPEELLVDPNQQQPPNPEVIKIQADIQNMSEQNKLKAHELDLEQQRIQAEIYKIQCECLKLKADAMKSVAEAEAQEAGQQFEVYKQELDLLSQRLNQQAKQEEMLHDYTTQQAAQQHEAELQQQQQQHEQDMQTQAQRDVPPTE